MTYSAEISRTNPTCFLFLLDQSGSMQDSFGSGEVQKRKSEGVSDAINRLLQNLVIKCARDTGVYDYFHIGIIGYGHTVGSAWSGTLAGREIVPISEIGNNPARIEERSKKVDDGAGGLLEQKVKFPIWFEPVANGGTPMCQALSYAKAILSKWVSEHPNGYPPLVIHITDGESTDGDPSAVADGIKSLQTTDGAALLFNLHLSATNSSPITFPDSDGGLPDQYAKMLFGMSSIMPSQMRSQAASEGFAVAESSRGYVFNADLISLVQFLDIGTRPSNLR
jgi:uncharacterized protein YegL